MDRASANEGLAVGVSACWHQLVRFGDRWLSCAFAWLVVCIPPFLATYRRWRGCAHVAGHPAQFP